MANVKAEGQIGLQRPDRSKKVRLECKGQNEVYDHEALQTSRPLEATWGPMFQPTSRPYVAIWLNVFFKTGT